MTKMQRDQKRLGGQVAEASALAGAISRLAIDLKPDGASDAAVLLAIETMGRKAAEICDDAAAELLLF